MALAHPNLCTLRTRKHPDAGEATHKSPDFPKSSWLLGQIVETRDKVDAPPHLGDGKQGGGRPQENGLVRVNRGYLMRNSAAQTISNSPSEGKSWRSRSCSLAALQDADPGPLFNRSRDLASNKRKDAPRPSPLEMRGPIHEPRPTWRMLAVKWWHKYESFTHKTCPRWICSK